MSVMKGNRTPPMLLALPFPQLRVNRAASSSKKWSICSTKEMWRAWRISVPFFFQSTIHLNECGSPFPRDKEERQVMEQIENGVGDTQQKPFNRPQRIGPTLPDG